MTEIVQDDGVESTSQPQPSANRLTKLFTLFILLWQIVFKVSDAGMTIMFLFLCKFIGIIVSSVLPTVQAQAFLTTLRIPRNVMKAKALIGRDGDSFSKYASCPKCHSIYRLELCVLEHADKTTSSKCCSFVKFPKHPYIRLRAPCNTQLMKRVRTSSGSQYWYPRQMFCYQSIISSLKALLLRPDFIEKNRTMVSHQEILNNNFRCL